MCSKLLAFPFGMGTRKPQPCVLLFDMVRLCDEHEGKWVQRKMDIDQEISEAAGAEEEKESEGGRRIPEAWISRRVERTSNDLVSHILLHVIDGLVQGHSLCLCLFWHPTNKFSQSRWCR